MAWRILAVGLLVGAGCTFQSEIPAGRSIACAVGGAPCPTGSTCRPVLGRCVEVGQLGLPAAEPVSATLAPQLGNAHATFSLDFQVTRALARTPSAVALGYPPQTFPLACDPCAADRSCHCSWTVDPGHAPPEGPVAIAVALVDVAGNAPPAVTVGSVTFDSVPPALIAPPSLQLSAPLALAPLEALGNGVQAEVCFVVSEPLVGPPQVWAGGEVGGLPFAPSPGTPQGQRWCFGATLDAQLLLPDGPLGVQARVTDLAGNSAVLPLPAGDGGALLEVDRTPPAAPDLSAETGLLYHRAPWGELPTIGVPHLELVSGGATLAEPGTLIAYADPAGTAELGRATLAAGQPIHVPLSVDQPQVWVQVLDRAGNALAGGPVQVKNVAWVLNLGRKEAGDLQANPHDCYARAQAGPSLLQRDDGHTRLDQSTGPTGQDGGGARVAGAGSWRQRASLLSDAPDLFYAFDPARGVLTDLDYQGATASFDGLDWSVPSWPVQPGLHNNPGITFDRARGKVVLFGGQPVGFGTVAPSCDLWELGTEGWVQLPCAPLPDGGGWPAARTSPVVGYDPVRAWTVVSGGYGAQLQSLDDTWAWDGTSWRALTSSPGGCPGRALTYLEGASDGGALVGFGPLADGGQGTCVGRWNGEGYSWTQPVAGFGQDRVPTEVVVDPATGQLAALVLNYPANAPAPTEELWHWDGTSPAGWRIAGVLPVPAPVDPGQALFGLAPLPFHPGGPSLQVLETDSLASAHLGCTLEPFACAPLPAQGGLSRPPGLYYGQLSFDARGQGLIQGAALGISSLSNFENWRWDNGAWSPDLAAPLLFGAGVGSPAGSEETWLYGGLYPDAGLSQDLWVGFPDGGWRSEGTDPTYQFFGLPWLVSVPDAGLPGLVAAGWGGPTMWLAESAGALHAVALNDGGPQGYFAYDPVRGRGVLADFSGQLWEAAPPAFDFQPVAALPLANPLLVFDEGAGALLAVGGSPANGQAPLGAVARWDGTAMRSIPLSDPDDDGDPDPFLLRAAAWDRLTGRTRQVAASPALGGSTTWDLSLSESRPALVCHFRFAAAQAPDAQPVRVDLQATASGGGPTGVGASLSLWRQGAWREAQRCTSSPCALQATVDDPAQVASLLSDLHILGVAVSPTEDNGTGLAFIEVDSLQATLTYRLP